MARLSKSRRRQHVLGLDAGDLQTQTAAALWKMNSAGWDSDLFTVATLHVATDYVEQGHKQYDYTVGGAADEGIQMSPSNFTGYAWASNFARRAATTNLAYNPGENILDADGPLENRPVWYVGIDNGAGNLPDMGFGILGRKYNAASGTGFERVARSGSMSNQGAQLKMFYDVDATASSIGRFYAMAAWDRVLTAPELQEMCLLGTIPAGAFALLVFDERFHGGGYYRDLTGNGNDLDLNSGGYVPNPWGQGLRLRYAGVTKNRILFATLPSWKSSTTTSVIPQIMHHRQQVRVA